ncbi:MAG: hypothetical protein ABI600_10465 [Luteolibacter sp.]
MKTNLQSGEIEARLESVRTRIRRVQKIRAAMVVVTIGLAGLITMMAADYLFSPLPSGMRMIMFTAWLLVILAAARISCGPLLKPIGLLQVARWLEVRHPEMEERLSTVLEMANGSEGVSQDLLASLARAAEQDAGKVDVVREVMAARTSRRWGRPASALVIVILLSFVLWPHQSSRLFVRALIPFSNVGNAGAGRFVVKPGNIEVLAEDAVKIEATYDGGEKNPELWMEFENGQKISQSMTNDGGKLRYVLDPAKSGFHYRIRAGRDESDGFAVTVWPIPEMLLPRVTLNFPEYTGVSPKESPLDRGIEAVAETRVTLSGGANTAVESAWLEMGGKRLADGAVEASANGGRISFSWKLAVGGSGEALVILKHRLGRTIEVQRFSINVLEDRAPEVVLLSPMKTDLKVRPDESLALKYEVTEDFSLSRLAVEVDPAGKDTMVLDQALPPRVANSKPPIFRGDASVSVGEMRSRFPGVNELRVRVRAEDARPADLSGPGVGFSQWVTLKFDEAAQSLARQELWQQHDGAKQTIEEAIRATREARERIDLHREEVKKGVLNDIARQDLKDADERLAGAEEKLKQLSTQMKESVHASKSDDVNEAADLVAKAREDFENSRLQDTPSERDAKTELARNEAEAAVKKLENVKNAMDREREKIEDLARLLDLAQQQQEVARQAEENISKNPEAAEVPEDWKNRQKQMEEALKQQLNERPDAKAEVLKAQAEQAKALADEANQMAKTQENLEQQAKQTSEESLQKALLAEQAKIADEAKKELADAQEARSPLADFLPEVTTAAETAHNELENGENQKAADSAKRAGHAMKDAAAKSGEKSSSPGESGKESLSQAAQAGSLERLAEKQNRVADAMELLAKGDKEAALKNLQAIQADAAKALAQDMENMPQVDGNSSMQDATNSGKQGSEQAKNAAEQGQNGRQLDASKQHDQSAQSFGKSAEALARAAEEFSTQAEQAAAQQANPQSAEASASKMADAFQQASQAADSSQPAQAAAAAAKATQALAQAAQAARQQMQGDKPGKPSPQGPPGSVPGQEPQDGSTDRSAGADPRVPAELAKLGISSADWVKIQSSLKSDVGAGEGGAVPAEYRELVKGYFESISKKSNKD